MSNWLPSKPNNDAGEWRLDIVSLLAVIEPTRPTRMPQFDASVVGVHNGVSVPMLNYWANIIHPIEDLPRYGFQVLRIVHREVNKKTSPPGSKHGAKLKQSDSTGVELDAIENGGIPPQPLRRRGTFKAIAQKVGALKDKESVARIPLHTFSPLNVLSVVSCIATIGLFIAAALEEDGTAMVALGTISLNSSIVGYASSWQPALTGRTFKNEVPDGDVVILKKEGAFLLVRCNEEVARELYSGPDVCKYHVRTRYYRVLVGIGTFLLMASVVFLGNCKFFMQAAIGLSYITLNGMYWAISLIRKKHFWNLDRYEWTYETPDDAKNAQLDQDGPRNPMTVASYTRTLWYAIRETKSSRWVRTSSTGAPNTPVWDAWLKEAEAQATAEHRGWDSVQAFKDIMAGTYDSAAASARAVENAQPKQQAQQNISTVDFEHSKRGIA